MAIVSTIELTWVSKPKMSLMEQIPLLLLAQPEEQQRILHYMTAQDKLVACFNLMAFICIMFIQVQLEQH
ncbi:MAG: hypothetical protein EZS28_009132 [Streblomastix strix]|uniref:Uncharacterized protein n=1 Tax=Streblomastix strix TaxID=222440 RepID=A0A5J4WLA3_9EUKA|nr:MAG: hypothetical protein EZS28_009132 [Streblomastix strix]